MIKFEDYFEIKSCPSFPGPKTDYTIYKGLSTSDIRTFIKHKETNTWYKLQTNSILKIKYEFQENCENADDVNILIQLYINNNYLEKL